MQTIQNIDIAILDFIQEIFRNGFWDVLMPMITSLGDNGIFWVMISVLLLCTRKYRKAGVMIICSLVLGLFLGNLVLKPMIGRLRPFALNPTVELLITRPFDYSFPSGHTMASFEVATVLQTQDKRLGVPALILAALIAFSRLYLYVHYPSDVLCGILLGVMIALFAVKMVNGFYAKKKAKETME